MSAAASPQNTKICISPCKVNARKPAARTGCAGVEQTGDGAAPPCQIPRGRRQRGLEYQEVTASRNFAAITGQENERATISIGFESGSDRILRKMHRKYRPWHYADRIDRIRRAMPDAAIGADVMVGFPGETDDDFEQPRALIERLPFPYLHVFTYSSRPGTPSAEMPEQVPEHTARERNRVLRELVAEKKREFMQSGAR